MDGEDAQQLIAFLMARHGERHAALQALVEGSSTMSPVQISRAVLHLQASAELDHGSMLIYLYEAVADELACLRQARLEEGS